METILEIILSTPLHVRDYGEATCPGRHDRISDPGLGSGFPRLDSRFPSPVLFWASTGLRGLGGGAGQWVLASPGCVWISLNEIPP